MGKTVKMSFLKGKTSRQLANVQNIDYSEKRKWPKGFICPCTGVKYHIQMYMKQKSGERLPDHWSSGYIFMRTQLQHFKVLAVYMERDSLLNYWFCKSLLISSDRTELHVFLSVRFSFRSI